MAAGSSRAEQGLFLTHFNKGKELFDDRRFAEAESEFEEAYLLKPRDPQVLNFLGIVYFKQEKLARAEEVYRKLLSESPEAHTLYYNLGLIFLKLARLEEAEAAFLKALDLAADNPKIHFYLGSIYERLHRFQDAIYRYRQAGAFMMVRRVEDKIAAPATAAKRRDDTAEFKAKELQTAIQNLVADVAPPPKKIEPVSPRLLAPSVVTENTARYNRRDTAPLSIDQNVLRSQLKESPAAVSPVPVHTVPPVSPPTVPRFNLLGRGLLEATFSGKLFIKQGTIYSYSGNLTFWVKEPRGAAPAPLVIVTGNGRLILTDRDREVTLVDVRDETIHVDPRHVLAAEEGLVPRMVRIESGHESLEFLAIEGRGAVALSVASRPLTLSITPELPASVPAASIIYWNGTLAPRLIDDTDIFAVMATDSRPGALVRLEGTGELMVEQWLG
jgi:tetratricopeptide (TPR) repeat protein/uncharacterized protein (AIM24 family)